MSFSTVTLVVNTGGSSTNATVTLTSSDFASAVAAVQNAAKNGGWWVQNTAAGVVYNQFIPTSAVLQVMLT